MRREIKFRIWDLDTKEWVKSHRTQLVIRPLTGTVTEGSITPNIILNQYTGLKDSKGVEVYEGDIVNHWKKSWKEEPYIYNKFVVKWIQDDSRNGWNIVPEQKLEVIGNIFENGDLLTELFGG